MFIIAPRNVIFIYFLSQIKTALIINTTVLCNVIAVLHNTLCTWRKNQLFEYKQGYHCLQGVMYTDHITLIIMCDLCVWFRIENTFYAEKIYTAEMYTITYSFRFRGIVTEIFTSHTNCNIGRYQLYKNRWTYVFAACMSLPLQTKLTLLFYESSF